jgi:hypothetical protein
MVTPSLRGAELFLHLDVIQTGLDQNVWIVGIQKSSGRRRVSVGLVFSVRGVPSHEAKGHYLRFSR